MNHRIFIEDRQETPLFRGWKSALRRAVSAVLEREGFLFRGEISVSLVSPEEICRLNEEYRDTPRPTDVLSFPLLEEGEEPVPVGKYVPLGDIVVCPEVIREQAVGFGTTYRQEFCLMVIHSTLHLLGWDHMEEKEKEEMFLLQEEILASLSEGEIKTESERIG